MDFRLGRWSDRADAFWRLADVSGDCWMWLGTKSRSGYGRFRVGSLTDGTRTNEGAHRVAFELATGSDPAGGVVMHVCDIPSCVRPSHLRLGTQGDNMRDCVAKGRLRPGGGGARPQWGNKNGRARLVSEDISRIHELAAGGMTFEGIGRVMGVSGTHAARIVRGQSRRRG